MKGKRKGHVETLTMMGRGRTRGTLNKFTEIKKNILDVFNKMGATEGMLKWARKNPTAFYRLVASLLPRSVEISGPEGIPLRIAEAVRLIEINIRKVEAEGKAHPALPIVEAKAEVSVLLPPAAAAGALIEGMREDEE